MTKKIISVLAICFSFISAISAQEENSIPFYKGYMGYSYYRIPAIIRAPDNSLLAFCEARKNSRADSGDIDLVMRRSTDSGKSWEEMKIIWDDSLNTCGNPTPVTNEISGSIFLFVCWNRGDIQEKETSEGIGDNSRRVFILSSNDNGNTWSKPEELTSKLKLRDWTWYATGPCHGIQKRESPYKGRLIIPANHRGIDGKTYSHIIFSDDHGKSWSLGNSNIPDGNESTVAELSGGKVIQNMRNYNREKDSCRTYVISKDGGETFGKKRYASQLIEPLCQGSILNFSKIGGISDTLLFSNPHHKSKRIDLTIGISSDNGKNWKKLKSIYKGKSAYSDMVLLEEGNVGILFENGEKEAYERISFKKIKVD
ncbi:MAG: sialidase family protein [Rikenellaceae bacterium]|nr:sialidase family protein [Rikenellaceae bacterium]